jgi:uncharacterized protein DUF6967
MTEEIVKVLTRIDAPYGRKVVLESVEHSADMHMLRIRIREGVRFTVLDIDKETALLWSAAMAAWAREPLH